VARRDGGTEGSGWSRSPLLATPRYSVREVAQFWSLSGNTIRRIFEKELGVIEWGFPERRFMRGYKTLRIPESVMLRVHRRLRKGS